MYFSQIDPPDFVGPILALSKNITEEQFLEITVSIWILDVSEIRRVESSDYQMV